LGPLGEGDLSPDKFSAAIFVIRSLPAQSGQSRHHYIHRNL
jgi:hypothetical protein